MVSTLRENIKKTMKNGYLEGIFFNIMQYTGTYFVVPFALALNASLPIITLLTSIPPLLNGIGQEIGYKVYQFYHKKKKIIITTNIIEALTWLGMGLVALLNLLNYQIPFEEMMLVILVALGSLMGGMAGPPFHALITDIIPKKIHAAYYGNRNTVISLVGLITLLLAGRFLNFFNPPFLGFFLLFLIAFISRNLCAYLISKITEVRKKERRDEGKIEKNFKHFMVVLFFMLISIYIFGAYSSYYLLKYMKFNYETLTLISSISILVSIFTYHQWGTLINKYGSKMVLVGNMMMMSLVSIGWAVATEPIHFILAEILFGITWSGVNLAAFTYTVHAGHDKSKHLAHYGLIMNLGVFGGALIGGFAITFFDSLGFHPLKALIITSGLLRFIIPLISMNFIKDVEKVKKPLSLPFFIFKALTTSLINAPISDFCWIADKSKQYIINGLRWRNYGFCWYRFGRLNKKKNRNRNS